MTMQGECVGREAGASQYSSMGTQCEAASWQEAEIAGGRSESKLLR
jgi:hypothetical protein